MTAALLLIDLQNDYFTGGAMELVAAEAAVAQAARLLQVARQHGLPVIHVQHIAKRPGATFFLPGTRGAEIHHAVQPHDGETLIVKHFPNAFRETALLEALRSAGASKIVVAGMMTHMCVDTTVRAAADHGFDCALAADACATRELQYAGQRVQAKDVQTAFLAALSGSFASVQSAQDLARALADERPAHGASTEVRR